MSTSDAADEPR